MSQQNVLYEYPPLQSSPPPLANNRSFESAHKGQFAHLPHTNQKWVPIPLRSWFIGILVLVMIACAVALEVVLSISQKRSGWATKSTVSQTGILHFVYTLPPVALVMVIVAMWTWTDLEIKKMQPYIDLAYGNAKPETTILLDYTRSSNYIVWLKAIGNRHWLVTLSALLVVTGLTFQPLAAALLTVKDIWLPVDGLTSTTTLKVIGQNPSFVTIVPFLAAAGYAEAAKVYNLAKPQFISDGWAVAPFNIPTEIGNGTAIVNTTAILTTANCNQADSVRVAVDPRGGYDLNATFGGCEAHWNILTTANQQFGVDIVRDCANGQGSSTPDQLKAPVFWIFDNTASPPNASVTFCQPNMTFANVQANVNVQTKLLNSVTVREDVPFNPNDGGNVTHAPMNGKPFNGIAFNLSTIANEDSFVIMRENATRSVLPAAIWQFAVQGQGTNSMFENNGAGWANLTTEVYTNFLALVAEGVYFVDAGPSPQRLAMQAKSFQTRLLFSPVAVHILTALLIVLAAVGLLVHILHRRERVHVDLRHSPGTIASAAAIISHTDVGEKLHSRQRTEDIITTFRNKRFRTDRETGKIVVERDDSDESYVPIYGQRSPPRTPRF